MNKLNKKYLSLSIFMFAFALALAYVVIFVDNSIRNIISLVLSVAILAIFLSKLTPVSEYIGDERDQLNIKISSNITIVLLNYVLSAIIFFCLTLYGITKQDFYLILALTELSTVFLILIISLGTQRYYEIKN